MSEAAQAFLTGFFKTSAENIQRRKQKAEDYMDDLREDQDHYVALAGQKTRARNNAESLANKIYDMGGTKDMVKAAVAESADPSEGLTKLHDVLQKAVANNDIDFVRDNADIFASTTIDSAMTGVTVKDMLNESYGIGSYKAGDYVKPESNWWDRLTGRTAMDDIRAKMDEDVVYDGMSIYDLKQFATSSAFNKVGGNSYLTYLSPNLFEQRDVPTSRINFESILDENSDYLSVQAQLKEALTAKATLDANKAAGQEVSSDVYDPVVQRVADLKKQKLDILNSTVGLYVQDEAANYYEGTYLKRMGTQLDGIVGIKGWTAATLAAEPTKNKEINDTTQPIGMGSPMTQVNDSLSGSKASEIMEAHNIDVLPNGTVIDLNSGEKLDQTDSKLVLEGLGLSTEALPDVDTSKNVPPRPERDPKYTDMEIMMMSEEQRAEAFPDLEAWDAKYWNTHNIDGTPREKPLVPKSEQEKPDAQPVKTAVDTFDSFFITYSNEMLDYMEEAGVTGEDSIEEITEFLAAWFDENAGNEQLVTDASKVDNLEDIAKIIKATLQNLEQ